jgi:acyl-CoA hydrolase
VPSDLNHRNTIFGGRVLAVADQAAGIVAYRHSGVECVTVAVDSVSFLAPAKQGEILIFNAAVNNVWHSSLEIGVKVFSQHPKFGSEKHILSAYFTFVAVDDNDKSTEIPYKLSARSPEEMRRSGEANLRRQHRLRHKRLH